VAVVGAGWAGLAAAIDCTSTGADVSLFEMAPIAGGRARDAGAPEDGIDNGQHICIGAYAETLRVLHGVGVAEADAFVRLPLCLVDAAGVGLRLKAGPPRWAFAQAVLARRGWRLPDRAALLVRAGAWALRGFRCDAGSTVAELASGLPARVRAEFIEPLCIAALNTPADAASGAVFLRVLHDALAAGTGASDLLLPRRGLGALLPRPALAHLQAKGATTKRLSTRSSSPAARSRRRD
jgi:predicted NAD/FAD-binding protein